MKLKLFLSVKIIRLLLNQSRTQMALSLPTNITTNVSSYNAD